MPAVQATLKDIRGWRQSETGEMPPVPQAAPRLALLYPNTYSVGMSSLGYQATLTRMREEGLGAERFFALAAPHSVDSLSPIQRFEIIAVSISFEMDWLHALQFLRNAKIPLFARDRTAHHPLILAGGVCVSVNRAPAWPFFDAFIHGEAEAVVAELAEVLRRKGQSRAETLEALGELPGVEITSGAASAHGVGQWAAGAEQPPPPPPQKALLENLDHQFCVTRIYSPHAEFSQMGLIDLARGCPHHCTFCWIGHNAPPYRTSPRADVARMADFALRHTDRIGLVASAVGAHPEIDSICEDLIQKGAKVSYSSLRVEEVTPTMLKALAASGQKSITIAPETGSPRLRRLLGKQLSDERILEVVDWALGQGMLSIKLYFMTGLPSETDDEAGEIVRLVERVRSRMVLAGKKSGRIGSVNVNLGLFVPKPNLPLLRVPGEYDFGAVSKRLKRLVRQLRRVPNTRVMASSPELNGAQGILSVGGLEASQFLLDVLESNGDWRGPFRRRLKAGALGSPIS